MPATQLPLIKGDKIGNETDYRDALPVNMTAVLKPILGVQGYMIQYPGLTQYATGVGIDRGGVWNSRQQQHFRVSNQKLIQLNSDASITELGDISGSDTVSLPFSFNTQGIVADKRFFLYEDVNGLQEVDDADVGDPIDAVWVDGYYFFTDGEFLYHTDIDDETSIEPQNLATSEFSPDPSLGLGKTSDNKVVVFNRFTTEFFRNVASENFAFQRIPERALKIGIVGTHAKAELSDRWYVLGGRKEDSISVYALGVGSAADVANREVAKVIGEYSETELRDVVLESYSEDNYYYIVIHLPEHVLLLNENILKASGPLQAWTILKTDVLGDAPWRGKHLVYDPRVGSMVLGDKINATIGILDNTVATQYGEIVEWLLYPPFFQAETQSLDELDLQTIPGHTVEDDATVFLSLTYDGVRWGKEWTEMYGEPYDYNKRFVVRRLGYIREWVGVKMRGATRSRMAFAKAVAVHG